MTQPGEIITLEITDLSRSGPGVGRDLEGQVVFVPFTAPGDRVRARIVEREKRYSQGELVEILEASPIRQVPRCPVFGRCGGCQWQHVPYERQWKTKVSGVGHALGRVGVEPGVVPIEELPAEEIWTYRNRVQLRGERRSEGVILGFYAARSHEVVSIDRCEIAREEINAAFSGLRSEGAKLSRPFKVEVEVAEDGDVHQSWNRGHAALGFRQVHSGQNEKLRDWVKRSLTPGLPLLDLFGGSGNLSAGLVDRSPEIHCVDVSAPARAGDLPGHYHFHRSPVVSWLERRRPDGRSWAAILDPPRIGLERDFGPLAESLERLGVTEMIAVGCDPDAWARDVSRFAKRRWKVERLGAVDLFPQTPHVESLARLVFV